MREVYNIEKIYHFKNITKSRYYQKLDLMHTHSLIGIMVFDVIFGFGICTTLSFVLKQHVVSLILHLD